MSEDNRTLNTGHHSSAEATRIKPLAETSTQENFKKCVMRDHVYLLLPKAKTNAVSAKNNSEIVCTKKLTATGDIHSHSKSNHSRQACSRLWRCRFALRLRAAYRTSSSGTCASPGTRELANIFIRGMSRLRNIGSPKIL